MGLRISLMIARTRRLVLKSIRGGVPTLKTKEAPAVVAVTVMATVFLIQTTTVPTKPQRRKTTLTAMVAPTRTVEAAPAMAAMALEAERLTPMATVWPMAMITVQTPLQAIRLISLDALTLRTAAATTAAAITAVAQVAATAAWAAAETLAVPLRTVAFPWVLTNRRP